MKDEELNLTLQERGQYLKKPSKWASFWTSIWVFLKGFWEENFKFQK